MKKVGKVALWVSIFSTLFMGCYSSAMIDPKGDEKEKIYSGKIASVVTKDGTKYEFDKAPTIVNDTIVGEGKVSTEAGFITKQVSIPLSDVVKVNVKEFDLGKTIWGGVAIVGVAGTIMLAIYLRHHRF